MNQKRSNLVVFLIVIIFSLSVCASLVDPCYAQISLTMGVSYSDSLLTAADRKYDQIQIPAGQHLFVVLNKARPGNSELLIRHGALSASSDYDDEDRSDGNYPDQVGKIRSIRTGYYYIRVRSRPSSEGSFTTTAQSHLSPENPDINYTYDQLDRLIKVTYPSGKQIEFSYDDRGNRVGYTVTKQPFSDVSTTYWAYEYIEAINNNGVTRGCAQDDPNTPENERRYCPENNVTRGQMAAFIIRAKYGETFSYTTTLYFTDVPSTHTFFKYVQKLKDVGITAVSGTYEVDSFVSRGQMAAFIIRAKYGETFSYTTTPYFTDVPSTHPFFKYVQKLKDVGITAVTETYGLDNIVTRAQMAAFLARAFLGMQ